MGEGPQTWGTPSAHSQTDRAIYGPAPQAGQGQGGWIVSGLKTRESRHAGLAQVVEVEAERLRTAAGQPAQSFTQQHRGAALVAALQVEMGHGDLQQTLENGPIGPLGFMPELLEAVVAGIPLPGIEEVDGPLEAGSASSSSFTVWRASSPAACAAGSTPG